MATDDRGMLTSDPSPHSNDSIIHDAERVASDLRILQVANSPSVIDEPPPLPRALEEQDSSNSEFDGQLSDYMSSLSISSGPYHSFTATTTIEECLDESDAGLAYLDDRPEPPVLESKTALTPQRGSPANTVPQQQPPFLSYPMQQFDRPASTPPALVPPPRTPSIKRSSPALRRTPVQDLDSIDEMDETDPFGISHHQDGPYDLRERECERVDVRPIRPAVGGPSWKPPAPSRRPSTRIPFTPLPYIDAVALATMSLNLQPGQLLTTSPNAVLRMSPVPPVAPSQTRSAFPNVSFQPYVTNYGMDAGRRASAPIVNHQRGAEGISAFQPIHPLDAHSLPEHPLAPGQPNGAFIRNPGPVPAPEAARPQVDFFQSERLRHLEQRPISPLQRSQSQQIHARQSQPHPLSELRMPPPSLSDQSELSANSAAPPRSNRFLPKRLVMPAPLSGANSSKPSVVRRTSLMPFISTGNRKFPGTGNIKRSSTMVTPAAKPAPPAQVQVGVADSKQKNGRRLSKRRSIF